MEAVVHHLNTYRQAKIAREHDLLDSVAPIFSWQNDLRVLLHTQSPLIRRVAIDALEKLAVNPADPMYATRGSRISVTLDQRSMNRERLSKDEVYATLKEILISITELTPEHTFVKSEPPNGDVEISLFLP